MISDCLGNFTKLFSDDSKTQLREIQALQTRTFGALGILLSNHGSDWIEQTIAGGLSYAEFANLKCEDIQAFQRQVTKFGRLLEDQRRMICYRPGSFEIAKSRRGRFLLEQRYDGALALSEQSYDGAKDTSKDDKPNDDNADFVPAALDCEGFKAMLLELNSMLKVEVEKH